MVECFIPSLPPRAVLGRILGRELPPRAAALVVVVAPAVVGEVLAVLGLEHRARADVAEERRKVRAALRVALLRRPPRRPPRGAAGLGGAQRRGARALLRLELACGGSRVGPAAAAKGGGDAARRAAPPLAELRLLAVLELLAVGVDEAEDVVDPGLEVRRLRVFAVRPEAAVDVRVDVEERRLEA